MPMPSPPKTPPWTGSHVLGVDENGMGPRLGPLVVTSVLVHAPEERGRKVVSSRARGDLATRAGDSKGLVAFEDSGLGEAWARAIAARAGAHPRTPSELVTHLALDSHETRTAPCPKHHVDMCWEDASERFVADEALVATCAKDLDKLAAKGAHVMRARSVILCTRALNDAVTRGKSRFDMDLHAMERLVLAANGDARADVLALCGKVGGFDYYGERFGPLAGRLHSVLVEGRAESSYAFPGVGRLAFLRDADERHLVVGLASLVGKWLRDQLMRRIIRYHRADDPELPEASGYHDPVTTRFIAATALLRKKRKVESVCFERAALGRASDAATSSAKRRSEQRKAQLLFPEDPSPEGA